MGILLINPPLPERTYPGKAMGLDYLAKELIYNGYSVNILDLDVLNKDKLLLTLKSVNPRIVGITNLSIQNDIANEIARAVKNFNSSMIVVKGGFHELFGYEITLKYHHEYVDYVVVGEGEKAFLELVRSFEKGKLKNERKSILGLAYYQNGVHFTGKRQPISVDELNEIIPNRLFYDKSYNFDVFDGKKTAQIISVRGCADACNFCTESRTPKIERKRSIGSIYSELIELANDGYEAVYFDDSTFTRDKERVIKICELFRNSFPHMVWGCNTRNDCLDDELISVMEKSGCVYMFTGFESAVPEVLEGLNKTHNPDYYLSNTKEIYQRLKNSSIKSSVFLIFGAPKKSIKPILGLPVGIGNKAIREGIIESPIKYVPETFEDVKQSLDFSLIQLKPLYLSMNVLRLLPGVPFSESNKFNCLRPDGEIIHAGYYDKKWYQANGKKDLRTTHHIYRAFEAKGSIVPPYMTPEYCYTILGHVISMINKINHDNHYQCEIVVDKKFEDAYLKRKNGRYKLLPFKEIRDE